MTKTVTLPLEWVKNGEHAEIYGVGPWTAGEIFTRSEKGSWAACLYKGIAVERSYHTDRETARCALEPAVLALGVQADPDPIQLWVTYQCNSCGSTALWGEDFPVPNGQICAACNAARLASAPVQPPADVREAVARALCREYFSRFMAGGIPAAHVDQHWQQWLPEADAA